MNLHPRTRWLIRRDGRDYGPMSTRDVLNTFERREMDLGTMVCDVSRQDWEPAGVHPLFRDHYSSCETLWLEREAHEGADSHERSIKRTKAVMGLGFWGGVLAVLLALGGGGWFAWRLMNSEPTGILESVRLPELFNLPTIPTGSERGPLPKLVAAVSVPVLKDRPLKMGSGVRGVVAEGAAAAPVTRINFDDDDASELPQSALSGITAKARKGLVGCAQTAAQRSAEFKGARVTFIVRSGRLGSFTVGKGAMGNGPFKACIKRALSRVAVPRFEGSERRVTIPLSVTR